LTVASSDFENNNSMGTSEFDGGGAIRMLPGPGPLKIYNTQFTGNAGPNGCAVHAYSTIVINDSTFIGNRATGYMTLAGYGGAIEASGDGDLMMCGDSVISNTALYAAAIHRVSINGAANDRIDRVRIDGNMASAGPGAIYIQDASVTMRQTSFTSNVGGPVGGLWLISSTPFSGENLMVSDNRSSTGLGAGLRIEAPGTLSFSTITNNHAQCGTCFSAALDLSAPSLTLSGTIVANNMADAPSSPVSCRQAGLDGGVNFQWPDEVPLCAPGASVRDPVLGSLAVATGPGIEHSVRRPLPGSPVIGAAISCPAEDILGKPRPQPCAAGAVEP
jgi:hypothetical protein